MKIPKRILVGLLIGLTVGYLAGVTTMIEIHRHEARKQAVESPELMSAKARLAELRTMFTDQAPPVQKLSLQVRQLEEQQHKL